MTAPPAHDPSPAFELRAAGVHAGGRAILDRIELGAKPGERLALIGPSGAGKTTVLRLLGASVWAHAGQTRVLGRDPRTLGGRALRHHRRRIGFLRQQDNLIEPLRVAHNVLMGRLGHWSTLRSALNLIWPRDLERARAALRQVELEHRLWALPDELSGGERQRVAMARIVVQQPDLILADEPTSALDIRLGAQIIDRLLALARERAATLVVSLHSLDMLQRGFDRVVALRDGRVHWQGPPEAVDQATLRDVYGAEYRALQADG